jgi:hypothetical protein
LTKKKKKHSSLLESSTQIVLFSFASILMILAALTTGWIANPAPKDTAPHTMAVEVFTSLQQKVGGLKPTRSLAVFGVYKPEQSVTFTDEKGDWFLVASFAEEQMAFAEEQMMTQNGYIVVQQGNCLIVTEENNPDGNVVWQLIKEARGV